MPIIYSDETPEAVTQLDTDLWWLKDPLDPTLNLAVSVADWPPEQATNSGTFFPRGRSRAVVALGEVYGVAGQATMWSLDADTYAAMKAALTVRDTLLLQDVLGRQWYVRLTSGIKETLLKAQPNPDEAWPIRHAHSLQVTLTEVDRPSVDV